MIADTVMVELATEVEFEGLLVERDIIEGDPSKVENLRTSVGPLVSLDAYQIEADIGEDSVALPGTVRVAS